MGHHCMATPQNMENNCNIGELSTALHLKCLGQWSGCTEHNVKNHLKGKLQIEKFVQL